MGAGPFRVGDAQGTVAEGRWNRKIVCRKRHRSAPYAYVTYPRGSAGPSRIDRFEYGDALSGWLKSVLTVPGAVAGKARMGDPTVAVGWADWVPSVVVDGVLAGVLPDENARLEASA